VAFKKLIKLFSLFLSNVIFGNKNQEQIIYDKIKIITFQINLATGKNNFK